jgi:ribonuclease P protein component
MRHREDFTRAVRRGRRAGRPLLAVHFLAPTVSCERSAPALVGLVVSRAVGPAVTRTRVKRRLRHLAAARLERLRPGSLLVVRANPSSAAASSAALAVDLDRALDRVLQTPRTPTPRSAVGAGAGAGDDR